MIDKKIKNAIKSLPKFALNAVYNYNEKFPTSKLSQSLDYRIKNPKYDYYFSSIKLKIFRLYDIIAVTRRSALGDVIASTCVLPGLRKMHGNKKIVFYTSSAAAPLLINNKYIDLLLINKIEKPHFDYHDINYENYDASENIFNRMGKSVNVTQDKCLPNINLTDDEIKWGLSWRDSVIKGKKLMVGVHAGFTMPGKYWPQYKWYETVKWLKENDCVVVEFGSVSGYDSCIGLSAHGLPLRVVMSMIYQCDIIICIDSMIMHMAIALNKKCIPLFGATDSKLYTPSTSSAYPISSISEYSKFHHYQWVQQNRWYTPCINKDMENCMESIEVQKVIDKVKEISGM